MGSRLEILKHLPETIRKDHSGGINSSEIWTNRPLMVEARPEARIGEISRILLSEEEGTRKADKNPQNTNNNGFEPFANPEPQEDQLFVNEYRGNFFQQMELNRRGIERVLKIAHLQGKIVLASLSPSRQRSIEGVNPDGSVAAKRTLFFGEKIQKSEKEENPLYKVTSIPEGWRIEINDAKMVKELGEKRLTGKNMQKKFIKQFNYTLATATFDCIRKEKLSGIKNKRLRVDAPFYGAFLAMNAATAIHFIILSSPLYGSIIMVGNIIFYHLFSNSVNVLLGKRSERTGEILKTVAPGTNLDIHYMSRQIDHLWDYLMPPVEIDKVARSLAFLSIKGRNLVIETKPEAK